MTDEEAKVKKLLGIAWENFKKIMEGHELEKNIMGRIFAQETALQGALDMAKKMMGQKEFNSAKNYLKQAEDHYKILEKFELMLLDVEKQQLGLEKDDIKSVSSARKHTAGIKEEIESLRKEIEQKMAA